MGLFKIRPICQDHLWELAWSCHVNICVYDVRQTREIYQLLPYSVDFKAPGELWNPLSKTVLSKYSFVWNKGHLTLEMTINLKRNLYIRPVDIFLIFDKAMWFV